MKTRYLGLADYHETWTAMRAFTDTRTAEDADEIWVCEHPPVYTLGQAGRQEHILNTADIPVVQSDRGGQVTYHGPGQVVVYTLVNLRRSDLGVREMVVRLENSVIALLAEHGIEAAGRRDAPGVYVDEAKIAALGLRIRNGCSYHGLSLNVDMDLAPFADIDPCGFPGLRVTQLRNLGIRDDIDMLSEKLLASLRSNLWPNRPKMETPDTGNQ